MARGRRTIQTQTEEKKTVNPQQGSGVRCPECGGQSRINNCVAHPERSVQGRYRECDECGTRFYTEESTKRITVSADK